MKKVLEYLLVMAGAVALVLVVKTVFITKKTGPVEKPPLINQNQKPDLQETISPEKRKIITELQTYTVEIRSAEVFPDPINVNAYDQIIFKNMTESNLVVKGNNWGGVSLAPQKTMLQPFNTVGSFSYQIEGLESSISGTVVVK